MLSIIGSLAGIVVSIPIVYYFHSHPIKLTGKMAEAYHSFGAEPIMPAAIDAEVFYVQGLVVMLMTFILALYPIIKLIKLKPVAAMRH